MTEHRWFRMYCEKTTSPCMQYLVMKHRSPVEKLFWILVLLCMTAIVCSITHHLIVYVWAHNPTVMFIANTETAIREIPFPAITICSSNQMRKWVWDRYKDTNSSYWNYLKQYRSLICSTNSYASNTEPQPFDYLDYDSIQHMMHDCAVSCSELFQTNVVWQNITFDNICSSIQPVISLLGICYKINMIPVEQILHTEYYQKYLNFFSKNYTYVNKEKTRWNLDDGFSSYSEKSVFVKINPARTSGVSYYHRFRLNMHTMPNEFLGCPKFNLEDGYFYITLSNPSEFHSTTTFSLIASDTYTKVQITPFVRKTTADLLSRSPEVRKCYMHNERRLSIFKLYTVSNCNNECSINMTISMCSCVIFNMAFLMTAEVEICGPSKKDCFMKALQATNAPKTQMKCNCLPTCSDIKYEISETSNPDSWDYLKTTRLVKNNSRGATVAFVFKNPYFTAYTSASILNIDSLISTIGGVLSLFMGLNLINICEILYVIIKVVSNYFVRMFK